MRFFQFFRRCGILLKVLVGICVLLAVALVLLWLSRAELLPLGVVGMFLVFFVTVTAVLACIVADAREDLEALMRYSRRDDEPPQ